MKTQRGNKLSAWQKRYVTLSQDTSAAYPLSLSHSPISYWTPGRSQADFLFGESVALCGSRSAPSHRRVGVGRAGPRNWARGPCGAVQRPTLNIKPGLEETLGLQKFQPFLCPRLRNMLRNRRKGQLRIGLGGISAAGGRSLSG